MEIYFSELVPFSAMGWSNQDCVVVKLAGCNFRCPYCNEPELLDFKEEYLVDIREVEKQILESTTEIKNVLFSGAEPTLQQQGLLELARFCKSKKLNMGIDTNGSKYFTIKRLVEHALVNFISLDIKSPMTNETLFDKITRSATFFRPNTEIINDIRKTIQLLGNIKERKIKGKSPLDKDVEIEVKTTIVPGLVYRKEDLIEIGKEIKDLKCTWTLKQFYRRDEEKLLDRRFEGIKFPSVQFLNNLKQAMQKEFPELKVEVREQPISF